MDTDDDLLLVGTIARAHGLKGAVVVNPETDFPDERFRVGEVLLVGSPGEPGAGGVPRRIVEARLHQRRPVIRLEGIESVDDAERLAGLALRIPASSAGPLPKDTYYRHDLVGCEVHDTHGAIIGRVRAVEGTLDRSYLVVPREGGEAMIPLVDGICVRVDIAARRVVVDPPEGLLDL
ncbi:ribosome maturation factor RimM [soil metagenome]